MPMGLLIQGVWQKDWYKPDQKGRFVRPETQFRDWVETGGSGVKNPSFPVEKDRYHLYVSYACPWAHRTLIARSLLKLEDQISVSVVDPYMSDEGWHFSNRENCIPDKINHAKYLREIYLKADSDYTGRVTVPVLWDKTKKTIVSNESKDILRMFSTFFKSLSDISLDLYPKDIAKEVEAWIQENYEPINNGVYKSGFAVTQEAYEQAVSTLFEQLARVDRHLSKNTYLCGDRLTEADICLFTTGIRFDLVYYAHFKCNLRPYRSFPNLQRHLIDLYEKEPIRKTCFFDQIKEHYYASQKTVNPTGIVPKGPRLEEILTR
jgi:putative glutathione S-transferase